MGKEWSIDQANVMSVTAQKHRLRLYLRSRDKKFLRNVTQESVITNSKQLKPKKSADSYKDNYGNRNLQKWNDTIARRKLIEDRNTIFELSGRVQELQNEVNCMNDSGDFQDAESIRSGNSHVTSRPVSFPPHPTPEGTLRHSFVTPSRREGPSIWDTHRKSGNVFVNPDASSSAPYPQELRQRNSSIEEPLHSSTVEKSERQEKINI